MWEDLSANNVGRLFIGSGSQALHEGETSVARSDRQHWVEVLIAGHDERAGSEPDPMMGDRLEVPPEVVTRFNEILVPGTTVLVTDEPITTGTSGPRLEVFNSEPPEE